MQKEMHNIEEVIENLLKPILIGKSTKNFSSDRLQQYIFIKNFLCRNVIFYKPCIKQIEGEPEPNRSYQDCVNV